VVARTEANKARWDAQRAERRAAYGQYDNEGSSQPYTSGQTNQRGGGYSNGSTLQIAPRQAQQVARPAPIDAGPKWTKAVESFVELDAKAWVMNKFVPGSVRNVKVVEGSIESGTLVLQGDFTFNRGEKGWVQVNIADGKFSCIHFWDTATGCRPIRTHAQMVQMQTLIGAAFSGGARSSKAGGSPVADSTADDNCHMQQYRMPDGNMTPPREECD
jgi:hypothetical protein